MGLTNNLGKLSNMITSTGSAVGIGTSSPVSLLNLSASTPTLTITDSAATGNGGNTYISSIKNGVGYNNLTFTAYSYTFLGGGSASTFLTINTAGAATFSSSVTVNGDSSIFNGGTANNFNTYALGIANTKYLVFASTAAAQAGGRNWSGGIGADASENVLLGSYNNLTFGAGTLATRMTILGSNGNVGIGTSSPSYLLHLYKSSEPELCLQNSAAIWRTGINSSSEYFIYTSNSYAMYFATAGSERMRITSGGNVGIFNTLYGINNVRGDGGYGGIDFTNTGVGYQYSAKIYTFKTPSGAEYYGLTNDYGAGTGAQLSIVAKESSGNSGNIGFYVAGGTERMRISANGNIRIGADGLNSSLSVIGTGTIVVLGESGGTPKQLLIGIDGATGTSELQSVWQGVAYTRLNLNPIAGAVYAGGTRLDTLSDARVKDNVQPITGALDKVLSITGKKFHLKDEEDGKIRYGFIAQELEGILDEFVIQTNMTFKKDDLKVENVKSIDNWASSWSALLVEAIKEQQQQIDELKIKIK